ncbi:24287_t:CDS:2, partial [Dentiscutata erythropus]
YEGDTYSCFYRMNGMIPKEDFGSHIIFKIYWLNDYLMELVELGVSSSWTLFRQEIY